VTRASGAEGQGDAARAGPGGIVIVGASLAGLMTALALSRHGWPITLLERSRDTERTGAALQVDDGLLERLTGRRAEPGRSLASGVQSWRAVHADLRAVADHEPAIRVHQGIAVAAVGQDGDAAWAQTADGQLFRGHIVIGADGYQSVVRRSVCPEKPDATFAGYLAWVGLADEAAIPGRFPSDLAFLERGAYHMLGFPLPGRDGSRAKGQRQLGWGWYDAGRNALLRATGAVVGDVVRHSLRPGDIPDAVFADLAEQTRRHWPAPWRDAILDCIARRAVIGTPVAEYVPDRLASGRLCLVGDAAHVPTPMTGNGFSASAIDAMALAEALRPGTDGIGDGAGDGDGAAAALRRYESVRLAAVRSLVQSGQRFSRGFSGDR